MKALLQKFILLAAVSFLFVPKQANACYSYFTHTNACAGDTVWFHAQDHYAVYAWSYGDTTAGSTNWSFDSVGYHVYTNPGTYWVTLFTNIGAEWDYYTTQITIDTNCFDANFNSACGGSLLYSFTDNSTGTPTTWSWNFGDAASGTADTSTQQNPSHTFTSAGAYNVQLIIGNGTNTDTVTQTVNVYNSCINASFYYSGMYLNCVNDTFFPPVNYSGAITSYLWNFGDTTFSNNSNPFHTYAATGSYCVQLNASNALGCADSIQQCSLIVIPDGSVFIPNAFTPNSDGINDGFNDLGVSMTAVTLKIFDRWGELVYYSEDMNAAWDGTCKGKPLQGGAYVYEADVTFIGGSTKKIKGDVTLLR